MAASMIKSCIISCKGGVPLDRINHDYKELIGEDIPFKANGFTSLNGFLLSIEGVTIENGMVRASSGETAHLEKMIGKQKLKKQAAKLNRYKNNKENIPTYKRNLTLPKPTSKTFKTSSNNIRATSFNQSTNNNHHSYNFNNNYKNFQYYQEPHFENNNYERNARYNVQSFKSDIRDYYYNKPHLYSEKPSNWQGDQYHHHHGRRSDKNYQNYNNNNRHHSYGIRNYNKTIVNYDNNLMSYWSSQYTTYLYLSQFYESMNCLLFVNALINH